MRLIAKERTRSRFDVDKTLDGTVLQQLQALILEKEIYRWNGFDKKDESILDGAGFHFRAQYEKGSLEAKGYMKYPKNYDLGGEALYNYLLALVPEAQQPQPPG